jgi:cytochrome c peroxidase
MQAFSRAVNEQDMLSAIAAYERTLVSFDSPFDHFIAGEANAIQRLGQTRLGIVQFQGPLQPVPCFDGQSAGCNPLHG